MPIRASASARARKTSATTCRAIRRPRPRSKPRSAQSSWCRRSRARQPRVRRPRPEAAAKAAQADERAVRTAALALLAGRDFTRDELTERLCRRGYQAALVQSAVAGLVAE